MISGSLVGQLLDLVSGYVLCILTVSVPDALHVRIVLAAGGSSGRRGA